MAQISLIFSFLIGTLKNADFADYSILLGRGKTLTNADSILLTGR